MRVFLPAALLVLGLASAAPAFDRYRAQSGETFLAETAFPGDVDEFEFDVARGTRISLSAAAIGRGNWRPSLGVFNDSYANLSGQIGLVGFGTFTSVKLISLRALDTSERIRVIAQAAPVADTVFSNGAYRLRTRLLPGRRFALLSRATDAQPQTTLVYGSYPGFRATVQVKWKGTGPVTIASHVGPGGEPMTSTATPKTAKRGFKQTGFVSTLVGDHTIALDVPEGTRRWSVTVRLAGKLPKGETRDVRRDSSTLLETVRFGQVAGATSIRVVGERGGANELGLFATRLTFDDGARGVPTGFAFDPAEHGALPMASVQREAGNAPTSFSIRGGSGLLAEVQNVLYDGEQNVTSFDAPLIRTPRGSGSASYSEFTYDASGQPTGWTERRTFRNTGNTHLLVVSDISRFGNGAVKTYQVVHTAPDGTVREYDFAPFNPR